MFTHLLSYRLKQLIKNKSIIFWSLLFPLILASFFKMAFSKLDSQFDFAVIPVAVVQTVDSPENQAFSQALEAAQNNDKDVFNVQFLDKETALTALQENTIAGYYSLGAGQPDLMISNNGLSQTFLKQFLQQFTAISQTMADVAREKPELLGTNLIQELETTSYTQPTQYSENEPSSTTLYFLTVIAMACMFGMNWGIRNSTDVQANQSPKGLRMSISPVNKSSLILANLLAAFLIFFTEIMLILAFIRLVLGVDFGNRWAFIVLTCFLSCLLSISLGSLVGSSIKGNYNLKSSIVTTVSVFGGFLSGMMFPDVKYWIDQHLPLLSWLNPTALVTDALYKLYYYTDLSSYFLTIATIFGMTIIINITNYLIMRRQAYVSL